MSSKLSSISEGLSRGVCLNRSAGTAARTAVLHRLACDGPLGFGASALGNLYNAIDDAQACATIDVAWNAGVRYFDTAPFYGSGLSERRTGDALRERPRDEYLLSTKVGRVLVPSLAEPGRDGFFSTMPFKPAFDYSYAGVMRSFEASLHRLGLARIDILLMHDIGRATHGQEHDRHFADAVNGGFRAMEELRDQGLVAAIGLGVNEIEVCTDAMAHVDLDVVMIAGRYTLLDQAAGAFLTNCHSRGVGVIAAGVFNSGVLATGSRGNAHYDYQPAAPELLSRVAAIEAACARFDVPLAAAALHFVADHFGTTTLVVGTGRPDQIGQSVALLRKPVPDALWQVLRDEGLISDATELRARTGRTQDIATHHA